MGISQNTNIKMRASILLTFFMLVLLLDMFASADDEVDRTFNLFKKKKEKLKDKEKTPKYKPDGLKRTFFKNKHKNNHKNKDKPSYKPDYHPKPAYHPQPVYHPKPAYHVPGHGHSGGGHVPYPISASRHFGASVLGPHHTYPHDPPFGPIGYQNNFPFHG